MDEKFCDYFDRWVKEFKEGNIREVTLDKYYCTSKALRKIAPALMMSELDRTAYQRILNVYGETHEKTTALDFHLKSRARTIARIVSIIAQVAWKNQLIVNGKIARYQSRRSRGAMWR